MTKLSTLEALRVQVLEGSSRDHELDRCIHEASGFCTHRKSTRYVCQSDSGFTCDDCGVDLYGNREWPPYTASIDAALTLVPEGWHAEICTRSEWPWARLFKAAPLRVTDIVSGPTPARSLIAACFKLRMEEKKDE